jgi:hypothetical protein
VLLVNAGSAGPMLLLLLFVSLLLPSVRLL